MCNQTILAIINNLLLLTLFCFGCTSLNNVNVHYIQPNGKWTWMPSTREKADASILLSIEIDGRRVFKEVLWFKRDKILPDTLTDLNVGSYSINRDGINFADYSSIILKRSNDKGMVFQYTYFRVGRDLVDEIITQINVPFIAKYSAHIGKVNYSCRWTFVSKAVHWRQRGGSVEAGSALEIELNGLLHRIGKPWGLPLD